MRWGRSCFALIVVVAWATPFVHAAPSGEIAYLAYSDGFWQVWVMSADGENARQVSTSTYEKSRISWIGTDRALLVCGNQGDLVRLDVDTGKETPVNAPLEGIQDAVAAPDGKRFAFSLSTADSIDDNNIWIASLDGRQPRKLTNLTALQHDPVWSTDGGTLYFHSGPGGQDHDIWSLSLDDHKLSQLTVGQRYNFDVAVSTTGDLAFSSNRTGNYELWLWPAEKAAVQLTDDQGLDGKPSFSPDGAYLAFESSRGGSMNIWTLDLATRTVNQLTDHPVGARHPVWRPEAPPPEATQ